MSDKITGQTVFNLMTKIYGASSPMNQDAYFLPILLPLLTGLEIAQAKTEGDIQEAMLRRVENLCITLQNRIIHKNRLTD